MRRKFMVFSAFTLKILAMITVLIDHIAYIFLSDGPTMTYDVMRIIGRIAFVLFAFFISEGVFHSRNKDKYLVLLLIMAAILQVMSTSAFIFDPSFSLANVFITLAGGASLLIYLEKKEWKKVYYLLPFLYALTISIFVDHTTLATVMIDGINHPLTFLQGDYGLYGLIVIIGYYLARKIATKLMELFPHNMSDSAELSAEEDRLDHQFVQNTAAAMSLIIISFGYYLLSIYFETNYAGVQSYALLALPFLLLYNGKVGHNSKVWRRIYYAFFPVHLLVLVAIMFLLLIV